jgi:predicted enzyme related to lactoylglutathione lyase
VPERDGYIAGVPCWVDTSQPDPDAAAAFYGGLFGWEFEDAMPAGSEGRYLVARLRGGDVAAVSSQPVGAPPQAVWNTYIWVEDADEAAAKAREAGGSVLSEPFEVMDAGRMAVLADPEGAAFCVWQARAHRGARIVNEPGSLNFNVLNVRDPEAAERFYGPLFGWTRLDLGSGSSGRCPRTATISRRSRLERASEPQSWAPPGSRTSSRRSPQSPAMRPTHPLSGASRFRPTTPTPPRRGRPSSAARCSSLRSTRRTHV